MHSVTCVSYVRFYFESKLFISADIKLELACDNSESFLLGFWVCLMHFLQAVLEVFLNINISYVLT